MAMVNVANVSGCCKHQSHFRQHPEMQSYVKFKIAFYLSFSVSTAVKFTAGKTFKKLKACELIQVNRQNHFVNLPLTAYSYRHKDNFNKFIIQP